MDHKIIINPFCAGAPLLFARYEGVCLAPIAARMKKFFMLPCKNITISRTIISAGVREGEIHNFTSFPPANSWLGRGHDAAVEKKKNSSLVVRASGA